MASPFAFLVFSVLFLQIVQQSATKCSTKQGSNVSYCRSLKDFYRYSGSLTAIEVQEQRPNKMEILKEATFTNVELIEKLNIFQAVNGIGSNAFYHFRALRILNFTQNQIGTIPKRIFKNFNLKFLSFVNCGIKEIEARAFESLPQLDYLQITGNLLSTIKRDVFANLSVRTLDLSNNGIKKIEKSAFSELVNLARLFLHTNHLSKFSAQEHLSFGHLPKLNNLVIYNNNLSAINQYMLEGLTNLQGLNLGFNQISNIEPFSFSQTPTLQILALGHNNLKELNSNILPNQGFANLKSLYLDHNKLMFLTSNFLLRLQGLKGITIGGNPWVCPCLDLIFNWLNDANVELSCDGTFLRGEKPICVVPGDANVCTYSYDLKLYRTYTHSLENRTLNANCVLFN